MNYALYNAVTRLATPLARAWVAASSRHRPLLARFAPPARGLPARPIWVHACSAGELGVARPVLMGLANRHPDIPLLLTVSTRTAWEMAGQWAIPAALTWFPVDHPAVVRRFFDAVAPRALVLMETEIWPNVLREAARRGVPSIVLNGRISDKHIRRYRRFAPFFRRVFGQITAAGVQHPEYADRFHALGVPRDRIAMTGNIKFDNVVTEAPAAAIAALRRACAIPDTAPVIVFGSTRPGDEALAGACWRAWETKVPGLRLVIAPRHRDRLKEAIEALAVPVSLRSELADNSSSNVEPVIVVDTMGELVHFYAIATVAVIGGSFFPGVNGHNPLEPAALGVPTVFGPYMRNFLDPAQALLDAGAAVQVHTPEALEAAVMDLLERPERRIQLAAAAREAIERNRGALDRSLDLVDKTLKAAPTCAPSTAP